MHGGSCHAKSGLRIAETRRLRGSYQGNGAGVSTEDKHRRAVRPSNPVCAYRVYLPCVSTFVYQSCVPGLYTRCVYPPSGRSGLSVTAAAAAAEGVASRPAPLPGTVAAPGRQRTAATRRGSPPAGQVSPPPLCQPCSCHVTARHAMSRYVTSVVSQSVVSHSQSVVSHSQSVVSHSQSVGDPGDGRPAGVPGFGLRGGPTLWQAGTEQHRATPDHAPLRRPRQTPRHTRRHRSRHSQVPG